MGLGANLPEDAIYPLNLGDESGKPLDGANKYTITFDKGATPPVNAFWSITLYNSEGFQVGNTLNRFAVTSWMPFKYNADGSLDLYFQNASPGKELEANWLPAPKGGFNLTMRLYSPKSEALTGKWNPAADREDANNDGPVGPVKLNGTPAHRAPATARQRSDGRTGVSWPLLSAREHSTGNNDVKAPFAGASHRSDYR